MYKIYLAGAIEAAPDKGTEWRLNLVPKLLQSGYEVFNPCTDTDGPILQKAGWDSFDFEKIRRPEHRVDYFHIMDEIVRADLAALLSSSHVIVYFDEYVKLGAGTYGEITIAKHFNIPVYLVLSDNLEFKDIPAWVIGCTADIFNTFEELLSFLKS